MEGSSGNGEDRPGSTQPPQDIPLAEAELQSVLSMIDDAVFIFSVEHSENDISFTFQWNNPAHESITGMTVEEFGGLRPREFLGEEGGSEVASNYRRCVDRQATIEYEETLEHEQGEVRWHTKLIPVIEDDTVVQIIGMSRDITDLVERTTHLQVVDRVLRHNIRNTLNLIQMHAGEIESAEQAPITDLANRIIESSNDLLRTAEKGRTITSVILDDSPAATLDVDSLLAQVEASLAQTRFAPAVSITEPPSATVTASPWLSDAVVELVQNAAEHHDSADPTIQLEVTVDESEVDVTVVDDGPGIPDSERAILAEGHSPGRLSHGGGLGMWMVYWIVHRSDGEITVTDREPRGSAVTIRLPRLVQDE